MRTSKKGDFKIIYWRTLINGAALLTQGGGYPKIVLQQNLIVDILVLMIVEIMHRIKSNQILCQILSL